MANPTKILFVAGEVTPFTPDTETASLVRHVPEHLQESGEYEMRILMPRYGVISERRNRLHEVIRLSGAEIPMGADTETLRVKVASIPGIRLQVYFMDNNRYFKRKGILEDKQGAVYEDNVERALFFGRSALSTIASLGWQPDVVHGFGWIAGFVPALMRLEQNENPLFNQAKIVYTPGLEDIDQTLTPKRLASLGLPENDELIGRNPAEVGAAFSDAVILPPNGQEGSNGVLRFRLPVETAVDQAVALYDQIGANVLA
jgi:starch synthase